MGSLERHTLLDTLFSETVPNVHDNPQLRHKHMFPARIFNKAIVSSRIIRNMTNHMLCTTFNPGTSFSCMREEKNIRSFSSSLVVSGVEIMKSPMSSPLPILFFFFFVKPEQTVCKTDSHAQGIYSRQVVTLEAQEMLDKVPRQDLESHQRRDLSTYWGEGRGPGERLVVLVTVSSSSCRRRQNLRQKAETCSSLILLMTSRALRHSWRV